ncbi:zinc transporter 1 [Contarinia nasturtii]|uniref:zinc transporter 1 n=1 Tax=Contarinia nasturtii TaxID=265458 RepID=UPI0012D3EA24|nr:zinc transporter 1 [Contarinia nasturtii]XP_031631005.1 zinc transporter 1 [Contarinia nasturtii]XP_031631006.1 zinc transporter 1 [Contarinia nasturtii]XP_031631007.1 zinc transporter 1 [Contarinia nasturtii]XP_031631009.1 zinc transporter 1 [Contarinia nasturtii]
MAMKELLYRLRPMQIYIVLALSIAYFIMQLFLSHITHALTLLVDSYHMLCNIVALSGCIITIKHCNDHSNSKNSISKSSSDDGGNNKGNFPSIFTKSTTTATNKQFIEVNEAEAHRRSLRNTFGWMRIEILTMLAAGIFLGSFCFSLVVEAIQTLIHIDHQDTMHYPVFVFLLSIGGLILNIFCYIMIGGYTYHQGSFLHITSDGDVVLDEMAHEEGRLCRSSGRLSKTKRTENTQSNAAIQSTASSIQIDVTASTPVKNVPTNQITLRTHGYALMRDISSTLFVMICSIIVYFADNENITKYVDPIISIVSGITLLVLSYPYMKESCLILLQTIPASIDIEVFKSDLLRKFDDIVSVHDLHIWQMTSSKFVSTVHILFHSPMVYVKIKDDVVNFFHAQGITIVTIQPEFKTKTPNDPNSNKCGKLLLQECLIGCQSIECAPKTCCSKSDLDAILIGDADKKSKKSRKSKTDRKSNSMLSLNVTSLEKLRKFASSTDVMKKSVSESHVTQMGCDDSIDSQNTSVNVSKTPSMANNLYSIHDSIDELAEKEFHEQCDARNQLQLPNDQQTQPKQCESNAEHEEDSTLLDKDSRLTVTNTSSGTSADESSAKQNEHRK